MTSLIETVIPELTAQEEKKVKHVPQPPAPETFLRDLQTYAEAIYGDKYRLRVGWNPVAGVWLIRERGPDGRWWDILMVQDAEKATEGNLRVYRPLDRRTIDELMESNILQKFGTGTASRDWELQRQEREAVKALVKSKRSDNLQRNLEDIASDASPLFARMKSERDYGHSHGAREFWQVPR